MMAQKHLHELLQEDQEPFQLKNYIADRRCQLKRSPPETQLQLKKRKPISQSPNFTSNFCKNACFFPLHDSPDPRKSPLFEFPSPAKSPCRSPNAIFLHIPARTAALLLEAAHRIQKQSSKPKTQNKNVSFSLFGSLRKKLAHRNKTQKLESSGGVEVSVKDILRWDASVGRTKAYNEKNEILNEQMVGIDGKSACEMGFSCSCNGRPSSAVWSESNEDKSLDLDLESSCSSRCEDSEEEIEFVSKDRDNADFDSREKHFCESPFRFVIQKSPSSGRRTPDFSSPETSPSRHKKQDKENQNHEIEMLKKLQVKEEVEEEEKEQCSPVSVLGPPFEDDNDEDEGQEDDEDEEGYDLECSYAFVQRAKQQLLHKLRRFEKLAELDPIELEKRMLEQEEKDDNYGNDNDTCDLEEEEDCEDYEFNHHDGFLKEVLVRQSEWRIPEDTKRLITDLIAEEEEREEKNWSEDREGVVKRVCRRLEAWREVESNTIDMMVEQDFRREVVGWKINDQEQLGETALDIELCIFGLLMEELSEELAV